LLTVLYTQFQTGDIDYIGLQGITADHGGAGVAWSGWNFSVEDQS